MTRISNFIFSVATTLLMLIANLQDSTTQAVTIHRFDKFICDISNGDTLDIMNRAAEHKAVYDGFVEPLLTDSTSSADVKLTTFANLKNIKFFYPDVAARFQSLDSLQLCLNSVDINLRNYLNFQMPDIYTVVSPYNQSIIALNDTAIAVALNQFLGSDYQPYSYYATYIRKFKTPAKIPYSIVEATLKIKYPYEPQDSTLLERIVYEGMIAAAAKTVISDFSECMYFNYTPEQIQWADAHSQEVLQLVLAQSQSKGANVKRGFLGTAPFSAAVSPQSPGGIGRWIGLKIATQYLSTGKTIRDCLEQKAYQYSNKILKTSKYNGN